MKLSSRISILLVLGIAAGTSMFLLATTSHAQTLPTTLSLFAAPKFPKPGEEFTVFLQSPSGSIDSSRASWTVNGKLIQNTYEKSLVLRAGKAGTALEISASVVIQGLGQAEKSITVVPGEVVFLWEADSAVPPLYRGKGLPSSEGLVKIVVLPELFSSGGVKLNPKDLSYTWRVKSFVDQKQSGVGKDTYIIKSGALPDEKKSIEVEVRSSSGHILGGNSFTLATARPELVFYERSPSAGILFNEALPENVSLRKEELEIFAFPFFFASDAFWNETAAARWSLNGAPLSEGGSGKNILRMRKPDGKGSSSVSFSLQDAKRVFNEARGSLLVHY